MPPVVFMYTLLLCALYASAAPVAWPGVRDAAVLHGAGGATPAARELLALLAFTLAFVAGQRLYLVLAALRRQGSIACEDSEG